MWSPSTCAPIRQRSQITHSVTAKTGHFQASWCLPACMHACIRTRGWGLSKRSGQPFCSAQASSYCGKAVETFHKTSHSTNFLAHARHLALQGYKPSLRSAHLLGYDLEVGSVCCCPLQSRTSRGAHGARDAPGSAWGPDDLARLFPYILHSPFPPHPRFPTLEGAAPIPASTRAPPHTLYGTFTPVERITTDFRIIAHLFDAPNLQRCPRSSECSMIRMGAR